MQKNLLEYLEKTAKRIPETPAFVDECTTLTFFGLHQQSRGIGTALGRQLASCNRPVVVLAERSVQMVAALLGVLYSGNFYVPLDSQMPPQRVEALLSQLQPAALIYSTAVEALAASFSGLCPLFSIEQALDTEPDDALLSRCRQQVLDVDPAYMIFTSGSTGMPKGIIVSHRSVIDFTDWFTEAIGITGADILGNQAPFCFDTSVKDLYSTLKTGATTHILPKKFFMFPLLLIRYLHAHQITVLSWSASAFHLVANSGVFEKEVPGSLKKVNVGGESLQAKQLNIWRKALPQVQYFNCYGPTEATVDCAYYPIHREFADTEVIPIGKACANMELFLLDQEGHPVSRGSAGELCVRGSGLAQGYYLDWEKTDSAFVQNKRNPWYPDRIYRTGDLAVEDPDGNFRFLTRKDNQVKHMGYRVELGEIETALNSLPKLQVAVCLFDQTRDRILCIYEGPLTGDEIAAALRPLLPRYMLPNLYHQVDHMPYTIHGKIDRGQLKRTYDENSHKL